MASTTIQAEYHGARSDADTLHGEHAVTLQRLISAMALTLCLVQLPGLAAAADKPLPPHYPESFDTVGVLTGINFQERFVVIDDRAIPLDPGARVHTPSNRSQALIDLKPGTIIGTNREHRRATVTEIWVMPAN
jgi:hypothetical protein